MLWGEARSQAQPPSSFELCTMLTNLVTFGLCSHKAGMISMYFPSFSSFGRQPDTIYRILNHVKLSEWYMKKSNSWNEGKKSLPLVQQWSFSHCSGLRESWSQCSARFTQVFFGSGTPWSCSAEGSVTLSSNFWLWWQKAKRIFCSESGIVFSCCSL